MPQFKNTEEARTAFVQLMRDLANHSLKPADTIGAYSLHVTWTVQEGYTPIKLHVRRWDLGYTHHIDLTCGMAGNVVGDDLGKWRYYCQEAMRADYRPVGSNYEVFPAFEDLTEAIFADVAMYLDGSYVESRIRPRSLAPANQGLQEDSTSRDPLGPGWDPI